MIPIVQQVASEFKVQLQKMYGNQLIELIVFGSYARGDFNTESDIDFAVVLNNPAIHPAEEILKITPLSLQLELKYGFMLSTLPVSWQKKQVAMQGIYQDIRKEGIVI